MSIKEQYWKYSLIVIILFMGIIIFRQITPFLGGLLGALTIYILVRTQMTHLTEKWKLKRSVAALLITAETVMVFLVPLGLTIWLLVNQLQDINLDPQTFIAPMQQVAEFIKEHDLYVLSDEIYSELSYQGDHVSIAALPGMRERTIVINGFSKGFAMTGWRLGYACAPAVILKQMLKIHQFAIMCAPTTSQYAAVDALKNSDEDVKRMRESYDQRRRYLLHAFREMGMDCFEPLGAFYIFPSIRRFGMSSDDFAMELLKAERVAVVPGTAFGQAGEGHLRVSYAYSLKSLKEALGRIERFVNTLESRER